MNANLPRRKFIEKTAIAAVGAAALPGIGLAGGRSRPVYDAKDLPTRLLGKTGVRVPLLAFGAGSRWMSVEDDDRALEILEHALDHGVYYWDTAASYGNSRISSEERIGKILPGRRKEVFLVSKTEKRDADGAKAEIERSLKRLNTDTIDMLFVHAIGSIEDAETLGDRGKVLEVFHDYRDQGIVKHIGFSGHTTPEGMRIAALNYDFEVMMIAMNHLRWGGAKDFYGAAVPVASEHGLGVVAMKVVRPRENVAGLAATDLLGYALTLPHFATANIGTDSMDVLKQNLDYVRNFQPLPEARMEMLTAQLDPFFEGEGLAWLQPGYVDGAVS